MGFQRKEWERKNFRKTVKLERERQKQRDLERRERREVKAASQGCLIVPTQGMKMKPPKLAKGHKANFATLQRAFDNGDVALVSAIRKGDKQPVALLCAMQGNADGTITPVPFAEMVNGNPFELYEDPTV